MIHELHGHTTSWSRHRLLAEDGTALVELLVEPMGKHRWEPPLGYEIPEGAKWSCELVEMPPPLPSRWLRFTEDELDEIFDGIGCRGPSPTDADRTPLEIDLMAEFARRADERELARDQDYRDEYETSE